jgi:HAD superfamily hydrolase (TIGR01509 family)
VPAMFEAAIFDFDGTLADTKKVILIAFHKTLQENHCDVSDDFIAGRIGIGASDTFKEILRVAKRPYDDEVLMRLVDRKSQLEIEYSGEVKLFDGALELLEALRGKLKVGLASSNNLDVILHMIKQLKVEEYFQVVLTAESISHTKPDPEIFLKCAKELDAKPKGCVVVEDSVFGVKAAKSAGMACVAVTTGQGNMVELEKERADLVVYSLKNNQIVSFILR